jgi:hypothetical protein
MPWARVPAWNCEKPGIRFAGASTSDRHAAAATSGQGTTSSRCEIVHSRPLDRPQIRLQSTAITSQRCDRDRRSHIRDVRIAGVIVPPRRRSRPSLNAHHLGRNIRLAGRTSALRRGGHSWPSRTQPEVLTTIWNRPFSAFQPSDRPAIDLRCPVRGACARPRRREVPAVTAWRQFRPIIRSQKIATAAGRRNPRPRQQPRMR